MKTSDPFMMSNDWIDTQIDKRGGRTPIDKSGNSGSSSSDVSNDPDSRGGRGVDPPFVDPGRGGTQDTSIIDDPNRDTPPVDRDGNDIGYESNASTHSQNSLTPDSTIINSRGSGTSEPWYPDPNASPEDNLISLQNWLANLFATSKFSIGGIADPRVYAGTLTSAYNALLRMRFEGLDSSALLAMAEKMSDWSMSLIGQQFSSALSYQSWYLQQEYNSPINQINRLTEAGLSSAFVLGNLSSGNASSPASVGTAPTLPQSGAGQIQGQLDATEKSKDAQLFSSLIGAGASFIPALGGSISQLMSAYMNQRIGKSLLPYQVAKAGNEVLSSAQTYENLVTANDEMKFNMAMKEFDTGMQSETSVMETSRSRMESAKSNFESLYEKYSEEYEELAYQVTVKTKSGHYETRVISGEETKDCLSNNYTLSDGSVVVGVSSSERLREAHLDGSAGIPFPGGGSIGLSGGGSASDKDTSSTSNTNSHSSSNSSSVGRERSSRKDGYSSDGSSFVSEGREFKSVTRRTRLPLPQFAEKIRQAQKHYQDLLDKYDTLSSGHQARVNLLLDKLTRNIAHLSSGVVKARYQDLLDKYSKPSPDVLVGD